MKDALLFLEQFQLYTLERFSNPSRVCDDICEVLNDKTHLIVSSKLEC